MNSDSYETCTFLFLSSLRAQAHLPQKGRGIDSVVCSQTFCLESTRFQGIHIRHEKKEEKFS